MKSEEQSSFFVLEQFDTELPFMKIPEKIFGLKSHLKEYDFSCFDM